MLTSQYGQCQQDLAAAIPESEAHSEIRAGVSAGVRSEIRSEVRAAWLSHAGSGEDCLSPTTKRAGEGLTAPAAAAALRVPMDVRFLKSKHSSTPSSPAQPNRPCTLEIPQALIPGDLAGMGDRKRPSARFSLRMQPINQHPSPTLH